jgi:hypothetical protein
MIIPHGLQVVDDSFVIEYTVSCIFRYNCDGRSDENAKIVQVVDDDDWMSSVAATTTIWIIG